MHTIQIFGKITCKPILTQAKPNLVPYLEFTLESKPGHPKSQNPKAAKYVRTIPFSIRAFGNIAEQIHRQCKCGDFIHIIGEYQQLPGFIHSCDVLRVVPYRWEGVPVNSVRNAELPADSDKEKPPWD